MFTSVQDRTVVVTGGSKGIGYGIARVFADAGATVVLGGRDADSLSRAAEGLAGSPGRVLTRVVDVADRQSCHDLAAHVEEETGGIDVLCANAGVFPTARLTDMDESALQEVMGINLFGTVYSVQACLPALERSGHGRVILTSSITGPVTGFPGWSHYGASKAAQLGFMRTAALELAPKGITINAVLPGNIRTEGLDELGPEYVASMAASIPQGRVGEVADIGYAALFFATDEAAYVTGQALVVDGGQILPESLQALEEM